MIFWFEREMFEKFEKILNKELRPSITNVEKWKKWIENGWKTYEWNTESRNIELMKW